MKRFRNLALRAAGPLLALTILMQFAQPAHAAGFITASPNSGPAGTAVTITGTGYFAAESIAITYDNIAVPTTPNPVITDAGGSFSATITVPADTVGPKVITARGTGSGITGSTGFNQTSGAATTVALTKQVSVNGSAYVTNANAQPGNTLTYLIQYTNTGAVTANNVTITDTLAPGQTVLNFPATSSVCVSGGGSTVSCPIGSIGPGQTGQVVITTAVNAGFSGTISNTAQATATNVAGTVTSNTTVIAVNVAPTPFNGNLLLCGVVGSFIPATGGTAGSVTGGGVTVGLAPGSGNTGGFPVTVGANQCLAFAINVAGQATSYTVVGNLTGLPYVCGVYSPGPTTGTIFVAGVPVASAGFVGLTPAATYCFLLNGSGVAYAVLSSIPTSIRPQSTQTRFRYGRLSVD